MSDQSSNNVAEFFSPGPGERLRAARLSMGFDLAKIASELHLTMPVVEALEADDYRGIAARVFVRGYLRNYARIVGMPVESILRQFDEKWPDEGTRHAMVRRAPTLPADGGPSRGWAGAMTWLLILGLVVLFLMWWRGYLDEIVPAQIRSTSVIDATLGQEAVPPVEEVDGLLLPADMAPALADGSLRLPAPPAEVAPEGQPDGGLAPAVADLEPPAAGGAAPVPPIATAPGRQAATANVAAAAGVAGPAPAAVVTPATVPAGDDGGAPVVEGSKQIAMTFNAACWVDVRDSGREFKLFGEMPKGTRKVLGGQPPYKVVIGNAQAVTITVNGRPFDLAPYAKGNVARFTLDP
jgi:cytoskeleton protein RodZ